jgi:quercetin dioxygenase-like cupin family protein
MALRHVRAGEKVRLASVASAPDAKTSALVKTDAFETAQLVLRAGEEIAPHAVPGYATIHCLEGVVMLTADKDIQLAAGDWLFLDRGERHSVSAIKDSSLLVTILFERNIERPRRVQLDAGDPIRRFP